MTPEEHYKKAEQLIKSLDELRNSSTLEGMKYVVSVAQVHATLANAKFEEPTYPKYDSWGDEIYNV